MARGNARDLAREKNQKKQQEIAKKKGISDKGSNQGLTLEQRKQRYNVHTIIMTFLYLNLRNLTLLDSLACLGFL